MGRRAAGVESRFCYPDSMLNPVAVEPIPLLTDGDGVVRVAGTRVTLDTLSTRS